MILKSVVHRFSHSKVVIIGGGCGGINISGHLKRKGLKDTTIFQPKLQHIYQPGQTMVGGNIVSKEQIIKPMEFMVDKLQNWVKHSVDKIVPEKNMLLAGGRQYTYQHLIVSTGVTLEFQKIQGAYQAIADPNCPVATIYTADSAQKWNRLVQNFKGGKVLFTEPPPPIKCAGAPQKIIHLTYDRIKHLSPSLSFYKSGPSVFGVPKYAAVLSKQLQQKNIQCKLKHTLAQIKKDQKVAVFKNLESGQNVQIKFDLLHFVPPQSAPAFLKESGLSDQSGFMNVDKQTMRSKKFKNVWGIGDCTNTPNSKTAAAIMSQGPVLAQNLLSALQGNQPSHHYDGYASCPIFVGQNKLMLAEFLYDGKVDQTFSPFLDQGKPNYPFYYMKTLMFPWTYWHLMPSGNWLGRKGPCL